MNLHLTGTPHATYICNVPWRPTWGRIGSPATTAETYGITVSTTTPTYGIHCSPTTLLPVTGLEDKWALPFLYGARGMDVLCLVTRTNMPWWHHFVSTSNAAWWSPSQCSSVSYYCTLFCIINCVWSKLNCTQSWHDGCFSSLLGNIYVFFDYGVTVKTL
jgi:hypothetical protein